MYHVRAQDCMIDPALLMQHGASFNRRVTSLTPLWIAQKMIQSDRIRDMSLPAYSPDLDPIEYPWSLVKTKLAAYNTDATWLYVLGREGVDSNRLRKMSKIAWRSRWCQTVSQARSDLIKDWYCCKCAALRMVKAMVCFFFQLFAIILQELKREMNHRWTALEVYWNFSI